MTSSSIPLKTGAQDNHKSQVWFLEASIPSHGVLTSDGITQIADHKYRAGSYTLLDSFLSPYLWQPLTDLLPMWLAPNLVTTIGGTFCLLSFLLSSWYLSTATFIPQWLYWSNGACMFTYYTFDCMDGKQARRTGSSSPLGQLFDHGMDCICNLSHLQLVQCIVLVPPRLIVVLQCSLQFTFWLAQWEEYYTGILPHAAGQYCGVTEVIYGMALWSLTVGITGREFYEKVIVESDIVARWNLPMLNWLFAENEGIDAELALQVRHLAALGWMAMIVCLVMLSCLRVYQHVNDLRVFASATSKFLSPLLLCAAAIQTSETYHQGDHAAFGSRDYTPSGWLSLGLCFSLITIKIIVYSMARMAYASIQVDILPFMAAVTWIHWADQPLPIAPATLFFVLDCLYFARLTYWIHKAIEQLCAHLKIKLFRIPTKHE